MNSKSKKIAIWVFIIALLLVVAVFAGSVIKTDNYNKTRHYASFEGSEIFLQEDAQASELGDLSVSITQRSSTWTKVFDLDNENLTEHNYEAHTYDFAFTNNTDDEVSDFLFKLNFKQGVFLSSAWNGALEIHQMTDNGEIVETIPDLRDYNANDYNLNFFTVDGENFVIMNPGDFMVYYPSSNLNALEVPIKANEGTVPGFIMYVPIGENIDDSTLDLEYTLHRQLTNEPLFWASLAGMVAWLLAVLVFAVTEAQIKKYRVRHERDNIIINESIETFTGFIDAKDSYTNGHSKRVATYTKLIAEKMGYEGDELDRIYYVALLHDCGKIGVPDSILRKPGRLTDEEFEIIKSHTVHGGEILSHFKSLENAGEGALYHHERYDGKGYPEGKAGEDIPLIARMICVADSFDAMNTNRVYRNKLTKEHIIEELESNKGRQFDPRIADIMLKLIKDGSLPTEE